MKVNEQTQAGGRNIPCRGRQATENKPHPASPEGDTTGPWRKLCRPPGLLRFTIHSPVAHTTGKGCVGLWPWRKLCRPPGSEQVSIQDPVAYTTGKGCIALRATQGCFALGAFKTNLLLVGDLNGEPPAASLSHCL